MLTRQKKIPLSLSDYGHRERKINVSKTRNNKENGSENQPYNEKNL